MKRIAISIIMLGSAIGLSAQNLNDALNFSDINYYGTARTIGMGNAVTAVGGDLGTYGINPAGSAVYKYGQFTITPAMVFSSNQNAYYENFGEGSPFVGSISRNARFSIPNVGISLTSSTGSRSGLKSMTFGFVCNTVNNYTEDIVAMGNNTKTSILGSMAVAAEPYSPSDLDKSSNYYNGYPWMPLLAWRAGGIFDTDLGYIGASEHVFEDGSIGLPSGGKLGQSYKMTKSGSKNDMIFNYAMNFSDRFYLGFNLGFPIASYRTETMLREVADDPDLFVHVFTDEQGDYDVKYNKSTYRYAYDAEMSGVYFKTGFIYRPTSHLRIGAAIQTPTALNITERYAMDLAVDLNVDGNNVTSSEKSPQGEYEYNFRTPLILNAGIAYTLGGFAMVSVDYEMQDFRVMKFSEVDSDYYYSDNFEAENSANKLFAGVQHMLRAGVEVKPLSFLALRAGCGLKTSPERWYVNDLGEDVNASAYISDYYDYYSVGLINLAEKYSYDDKVSYASFGMGFDAGKSFFADFAIRVTSFPELSYAPYDDYIFDGGAVSVFSPDVRSVRTLTDAVLTLGWRF